MPASLRENRQGPITKPGQTGARMARGKRNGGDNGEDGGPVGRGDALAESAYQRIRAAIGEGVFAPGQRVIEANLADWLEVSRTPVREAVQRLEAEGLFAHSPRQGLIVRRLEYQEVVELYAMREVVEATAARMAARQATEPEIDILTDLHAMERAATPGDYAAAARLNRLFHEALHDAAHNRYLIDSLRPLDNAMILLENTTLSVEGRRDEALDEHRAIIDAIRARDADGAADAAAAHIRTAQRKRLNMILRARQ